MLVENLPVPGDERVWSEAKTLRDTGFQVSVICPKGTSYFRESHICLENIDIYRYQLPQTAHKYTAYFTEYTVAILMTFLLSLKVWLRHGIDVIHACNPPDLFFVIGLFYHCFGKKFVFDQHDPAPEMFQAMFKGHMKLLHKVLLFLEWCTYRTADVVITTNVSHKRIATGRGHRPSDKVFVVRNGPDLKRMHPVPPEPQLKGGRHHMLAYAGVMGILDGVDYALRSLDILVHRHERADISLVLMGDGDDVGRLHALVHELKLDEYVNFVGWTVREDMVRYLSVADIGLSPEPENGLNELCTMNKILDYMAMELPIVAFDLAETRYSAQGAALYATPNNVEDFANKVGTLLDNEELRTSMGIRGRKRIERELCWVHSTRDLLRAYGVVFPAIKERLISASSQQA